MSKKDTDIDNGTITVTYREDEGEVDNRRLAGIMGVATTAGMALLIVTFSLGMVGAALGVGLGGFVANFDNVSTDSGASIAPVIGEQAACDNAPQLAAVLSSASITDASGNDRAVEFMKDIPLPSIAGLNSGNNFTRITIASSEVPKVTGLALRLSALSAETAVLKNGNIAEIGPDGNQSDGGGYDGTGEFGGGGASDSYQGVTQNPGDTALNGLEGSDGLNNSSNVDNFDTEFGISAQEFTIDNGTAAAHQVAFDNIQLADLNLFVQVLNASELENPTDVGMSERAPGLVADPISPGDRGCASLSEEASVDSAYDVTNSSGAGIALNDQTADAAD
jgi:hypothetical protein